MPNKNTVPNILVPKLIMCTVYNYARKCYSHVVYVTMKIRSWKNRKELERSKLKFPDGKNQFNCKDSNFVGTILI